MLANYFQVCSLPWVVVNILSFTPLKRLIFYLPVLPFSNSFFGGRDTLCLLLFVSARDLCGLPLCRACVCFPIICKFIRVTVLFYVGKNFLRVIHQVWLLQSAVSSSQTPGAWEERKAIDILFMGECSRVPIAPWTLSSGGALWKFTSIARNSFFAACQ